MLSSGSTAAREAGKISGNDDDNWRLLGRMTRAFNDDSRPRSSEFIAQISIWLGRNFLSQLGLIECNPGPLVDFTKLKGTKVFHLNVGSRLEKRLDKIKDILHKFSHKTIFTITESGLTPDLPNDVLKIKNFYHYRHDNTTRKSLGIVTYWSKDIKLEATNIYANQHATIIFHAFKLGLDKLHFGTIYRLPDGGFDHEFSGYLENALQNIVHSERQVLAMGDVNIDLLKPGRKQTEYLEVLDSFEMKQHVRRSTRNCGTSSTLIDHIVSTDSVNLDQIANTNVMISDHHLIGCRLKSFGFKAKLPIQYQQCRLHTVGLGLDFAKCNIPGLGDALMQADWTDFEATLCVETMWAAFKNQLLQKISQFTPKFPCKCGKKANARMNDKPWYSNELRAAKRECDIAYNGYCMNGKTLLLYERYRTLKNRYNTSKERCRRQYHRSLILNSNSYKEKWKVVNTLRGKDTTEGTQIEKLVTSNGIVRGLADVSNILNDHFSTIGANTLAEVNNDAVTTGVQPHTFPRNSPPNSFKFQIPTIHTVIRAFEKLKANKPAGPTGIPPHIIKAIGPAICGQITHLFAACVLTGQVPGHFKEAHVTPIFKKGDPSDVSNYRPISVTGTFSKLFEQVLLWQIETHMERYQVLAPSQYGFRRHHSTTHAMIDSIDYAYTNLNKKDDAFISFLYLDLSKAFDCIDLGRLKIALDSIGFDDHSQNLLIAYLSNRSQAVKLNGKISDIKVTNCGVAQGSLIGPLIFSIYVNDCYRVLTNEYTKIVQYADDVAIMTCAATQPILKFRTERNLLNAKNYFTSLGLKLNVSKTQYVPSTNSQAARNALLESVLNDNLSQDLQVHAQTTATHLGLIVDHELSFTDHKQSVLSKLKSAHGLVRSIRNKLTPETAKDLYNALFLSCHDYAAAVYGTTGHGTAEIAAQLEVVHRKMIKCVFEQPWDTANADLYANTMTSALDIRRKSVAAKMTYACVHGKAPPNLCRLFQRSQTTERAIEQIRLMIPLAIRTNLFKNSFKFRGSTIWNNLPPELRVAESIEQFSNHLPALLHMQ
jgi:hypothetical protein